MTRLVLASSSPACSRLLEAAGGSFDFADVSEARLRMRALANALRDGCRVLAQ